MVVILAGTNDIAGNTGPMSLEEIEANLASMVELARAHGIRVVLSSVLPVHNYTPQSELAFPLRPPEKIAALNKLAEGVRRPERLVYLDYAAAMADERGFLKARTGARRAAPEQNRVRDHGAARRGGHRGGARRTLIFGPAIGLYCMGERRIMRP